MGDIGSSGFSCMSAVTKKRRSATARRPRPDSHFLLEGRDASPPLSLPSSDNSSRQSPDGSAGPNSSVRRKEVNLNSLIPKSPSTNRNGAVSSSKDARRHEKSLGQRVEFYYSRASKHGSSAGNTHKRNSVDLKQSNEDVSTHTNLKSYSKRRESSSPDGHIGYGKKNAEAKNSGHSEGAPNAPAENKLTRVKLKLGGVTRTIHAKSNTGNGTEGGSLPRLSSLSSRRRQKNNVQDDSRDHQLFRDVGLQPKPIDKGAYLKKTDKLQGMMNSEPVRKSKRTQKKRALNAASDDEDEDDEIRYLEKLRASKVSSDHIAQHESGGSEYTKKQKSARVQKRALYEEDHDFSLAPDSGEARKKARSERDSYDLEYTEDDVAESDEGKGRKERDELVDSLVDGRKEVSLTTRQRALQSAKDGNGGNNTSLIEFPNGLPPAAPRKQKEKLSEVEQQLKKAEAAQRRRMQVEKAARESEAEAIRKILGQDSSRKKREENLQKKREQLAQAKAARSMEIAASSVRWIIGPTGTTVTFPESVGLPSIFNSAPCSYPSPREKCAGPSCTNAYKYRDSKSNLPLCSLQCYKAVRQSAQIRTC